MTTTENIASPVRPAPARRWPGRVRIAVGLAAATLTFALMAVANLSIMLALPFIGLCFAWIAPTRRDGRWVALTWRNAIVGLLALAGLAVVALLPQETVFLLATVGADAAMLVIAIAGVVAIGLPLALQTTPVTTVTEDARPWFFDSRDVVLVATGLVTLALAHVTSSSYLAVLVFVVVGPLLTVIARVWQARRRNIETGLWRQPLSPTVRPHLVQLANHWLLFALIAATVPTGAYDLLRWDLPSASNAVVVAVFAAGLGILALLATVPARRVRLAPNVLVLLVSVFLAGQLLWIYRPPVDPVRIASPLTGEWYVVHGGRAELVNGHNVAVAQDFALDLVQSVDGRTHDGSTADLAAYFAWDEPVSAPAAGHVVTVVDEFPDQPIGSVDLLHPAGNQIVLDIGQGRYVAFGHLRSGSIAVAVGDEVRAGQPLARVGNSGNSDEPHLHLQAQNSPIFDVIKPPPGLRTYPLVFDNVEIRRGKSVQQPALADVRRGDLFSPRS